MVEVERLARFPREEVRAPRLGIFQSQEESQIACKYERTTRKSVSQKPLEEEFQGRECQLCQLICQLMRTPSWQYGESLLIV